MQPNQPREQSPEETLGNIKSRNLIRQLLGASVGALAIFILGFCLVPTLISEASATQEVSASVTWQAISLTLDPHGDINFYDIIPSGRDTASGAYGTQKVVKKQIDVTTEGQYYAVYLSTTDADNSLTVSEDSARSIPATSDSIVSGFAQSSWGYAVPTTETSATLSAYDSFLANASGIDTAANNLTKTGTGSQVYNTGKWSSVPSLGNAVQIQRNSTNVVSGFDSGDSFYIYYSIMVDNDVLSGTYENQVLYTAIASTSSLDTLSENIMRDKDTALSMMNELETLEVDLVATDSTLTISDINIYLVPHSIIATNNYDVSSLTATDYPKCATNSIDTTGASSNSISATITCKLPPIGTTGTTSSSHAIAQAGEYDFWVIINTPNGQSTISYLSHCRATDDTTGTTSDIASITYSTGIGLQTIHTADGDPDNAEAYVKTMQEMTGSICQNTTAFDSASSAATTFSLKDVRDDISYRIRKLGDDCWMVDNLRFVGTTLDPETSDVAVATNINYEDAAVSWSFTEAKLHEGLDPNGDPTVWYNYAVATAMTVAVSIDTAWTEAEHSLCPANWKLPSASQAESMYPFQLAFLPVAGGSYDPSGSTTSLNAKGNAYWKTSTPNRKSAYTPGGSENIQWVGSVLGRDAGYPQRACAQYVRCVARD
ncbi:hypothetical protein IKE71_01835 [Candidatus Saccharibacteria bacterium]|nr:hypothetical protein [Candidatus Saccharibacteria bacterium]